MQKGSDGLGGGHTRQIPQRVQWYLLAIGQREGPCPAREGSQPLRWKGLKQVLHHGAPHPAGRPGHHDGAVALVQGVQSRPQVDSIAMGVASGSISPKRLPKASFG